MNHSELALVKLGRSRESLAATGEKSAWGLRGRMRLFPQYGGISRGLAVFFEIRPLPNQNAPDLTGRGRSVILEHETRFELATPTLAKGRRSKR